MMKHLKKLMLQMFAGEGDGAATPATGNAGAPAAAESGSPAMLADGTVMDHETAARIEEMRKEFPDEFASLQVAPAPNAENQPQENQTAGADDIQARWEAAKKGEFAELYGRDVQNAVHNRFRNQQDASQQLQKIQPILDALYQKNGIQAGDLEALTKAVTNDEEAIEAFAEENEMSTESAKLFMPLQQELNQLRQEREQQQEESRMKAHFDNLQKQAADLKKSIPDFDLMNELNNPKFLRMTAPEMGFSLEEAYWAVHGKEKIANAAKTGVQYARDQISQSLQANSRRPTEGAMNGNSKAATTLDKDFSKMSAEEINAIMRRARETGQAIIL